MIKVVISCPLDTYSGYGARARDLVKAFIKLEKYDVKVLSQRWGNTRFGYLKDHNETDLISRIIPNVGEQPDIWIQITVPNEFQRVGKYNIGVTAGMETTLIAQPWIEGCNRMDLVLTSSKHSKDVILGTTYELKNKTTNATEKVFKVSKPVEVLKEGADLEKYFVKPNTNFDLSPINEQFCFLFVGHWMQGILGEDRKNVGWTIKTFLETFKNKQTKPALILKTQQVGSSILDKERILDKIEEIRKTVKGSLPNIYLITGEISDEEMNNLYNNPKVKAMISFTKGEGFGRPLLEFSLTGKPIIASGWSGQIDFLNNVDSLLVGGKLNNVHDSAAQKDMIIKESQWFQADEKEASTALSTMYKKYKDYIVPAKRLKNKNIKEFSFESMVEQLDDYLVKYVPEFPKQVELNLPKLELPKLQKIDG